MEQKSCSTNIKVAIRIRPFLSADHKNRLCSYWGTQNNVIYQVDENGHKFGEGYSFDHIFEMNKTNSEIYTDVVKDFVNSSIEGLNSTIFTYGQTSSGKTYTMLGDKKDTGIVPLAVEHIFHNIENNAFRKFLIRVSYMEIYNEKINDLLDTNNKDIKIREFPPSTIALQNIKEELVSTREQMYDCLKRGNSNRRIGSTDANVRSSRSHTIFKITIESTQISDLDNSGGVQVSNLNLVDLAGSERVAQTKATGMRLKEGGHINKSLSALSLVIKQLSDGQEFVNFRDSKLTRLLQDSIGGNSKTLIIATITTTSIEDTASTLAFAQRAKTVKNKPFVNEILTDADVSKRYATLNTKLQKKLEEQMRINQKLRVTQEENEKEMSRLQQQMEMLEDFQNGCHTPSKSVIKRRHTIGFSAQKISFKDFSLKHFDKGAQDSDSCTLNPPLGHSNLPPSMLEPILEDEPVLSFPSSPTPSERMESTPPCRLKVRLSALEQEYNELLSFTRNEDNIFNETSQELDNVRRQLSESQTQVNELKQKLKATEQELADYHSEQEMAEFWKKKYHTREQELCSRISELENQPQAFCPKFSKNDCTDIMEMLISLESVLKSPDFIDDSKVNLLQTIEKFNMKVKTSKDIIESEILKQISNFDKVQTTTPNELASFNDLLHELSLFDSEIPVDLINNMKKESIEDLKILIKIYEFLIRKNEFVKECTEKVKSLEAVEAEKYQLNLTILKIGHEKTVLVEEIEKLKSALHTQSQDLDSVTSDLMDTGEMCATLKQEKEKLLELLSDSENASNLLRREMESMKSDDDKDAALNSVKMQLQELQQLLNNTTSENEDLKKEIVQLKEQNESYCNDVENLQRRVDELLFEITSQSEKTCSKIEEEIRVLKHESNSLAIENDLLKREMDELRCLTGSENLKDYIDKVSVDIIDKERLINEIQNMCTKLKEENERFLPENVGLHQEIEKLKDSNTSYFHKIQIMESEISELSESLEKKEASLVSLENDHRILTDELEDLKLKSSRFDLQTEDHTRILTENKDLHEQVAKLKDSNISYVDKIQILESEISKLTANLEKKEASLISLENYHRVLMDELEDLKLKTSRFDQQTEDNNKILTENGDLQQQVAKLKDSNTLYFDKIQTLESQISELTSNLEKKEASIISLENDRQVLTGELEALKLNSSQFNLQTMSLEEDRNSILTENKDLQQQVEKLKDSNTFYLDKIQILESKIDELTSNLEKKESSLTTLESDHHLLTEELEALKLKTSQFITQTKSLEENNNSILTENRNLHQQLEKLKDSNTSYLDKIQILESKIGELTSNLEKKESSLASLESDHHALKEKLELLKLKSSKFNHEMESLKLEVDKLSQENAEKNCTILEITKNLRDVTSENDRLKKAVETVKNEKNTLNSEIIKHTTLLNNLKVENDSLKLKHTESNHMNRFNLDNQSLQTEVEKLKACNDTYSKRINALENELTNVNLETRKTADLEKRSSLLKQNVVRLKKENSELSFENRSLKREIANLNDNIDKFTVEISEKDKFIYEEQTKNIELRMNLEKSQLQIADQENLKAEIKNLKTTIEKYHETNNINEENIKQSKMKLQQQKQMLECAQSRIDEMKSELAEKEKIKCENSQYKMEISLNNKKLEENSQLIKELQLQIKCLQNCDQKSGATTFKDEDKEECSLKELEDVLCNIIEQVVNDQKSLLLIRHSQDERDHFSHILKELKFCCTNLKCQLKFLQERKKCNLNMIKDCLSRSRCLVNDYISVEKSLIRKQMEQLETGNKAYLQEIMVLQETKDFGNNGVCQQCQSLKIEIGTLKQTISSQEEALNLLKAENTQVEKDHRDGMKEIFRLRTELYAEQDRKEEVAYTDWLKFCEENYQIEKRKAKTLEVQVKNLEKQLQSQQSHTVEPKCKEVQCDLYPGDSVLQEKYNKMKHVCIMRNQKISELQAEINRLESLPLDKRQEETERKSKDVQCNFLQGDSILQDKYNKMKHVCIMRNQKIAELQAEINRLESFVNKNQESPETEARSKESDVNPGSLQEKYHKMKHLCILRNQKISQLQAENDRLKSIAMKNGDRGIQQV